LESSALGWGLLRLRLNTYCKIGKVLYNFKHLHHGEIKIGVATQWHIESATSIPQREAVQKVVWSAKINLAIKEKAGFSVH
jgi:hypothetical protein